jgi:TfoX/Sxy family transcriptional regulator of competence genes
VATSLSFVEYVADQMRGAGDIRYRKMFGEYAVYCTDKVVALICDDRLFVKETSGGRALIGDVVEAPPYAGAKPHFLIEDRLDDPEWLAELIRVTESELPAPKPKPRKPKRATRPSQAADSSE